MKNNSKLIELEYTGEPFKIGPLEIKKGAKKLLPLTEWERNLEKYAKCWKPVITKPIRKKL